MQHRTCPVDGAEFEPRSHNQLYCSRACYRKQENERYRSHDEIALCPRCGDFFHRPRGVTRRIYCTPACHRAAKHERFVGRDVGRVMVSACPHGTDNVATCPACTNVQRADKSGHVGMRTMLRSDPCAYCSEPGGSLDHIDPVSLGGDDDWTNWTGACHRCNSTKGRLTSLLRSLVWIRVAREYHDLRRSLYA